MLWVVVSVTVLTSPTLIVARRMLVLPFADHKGAAPSEIMRHPVQVAKKKK